MVDLISLNEEEQKQWWSKIAGHALSELGMKNADAALLAYTHNAIFEVTYQKQRYVLHLNTDPNGLNLKEVSALAAWLRELNQSDGVSVPTIILQNDGLPAALQIEADGNLIGVILYGYLEGKSPTPLSITPAEIHAIGQFLGRMHQQASQHQDNRAYPFDALDYAGLFGVGGRYDPGPEALNIFTEEQTTIMGAVAERVHSAMEELGQGSEEFGLIHGDFLLKNILLHQDQIRAIDFEYCGWGYYLYDLTPLLWQLKPQERYPELAKAFWQGYTSIRPLTKKHQTLLETFIAGRQIASMRWVAANRHNPAYQGKVIGIIEQRSHELQGFLESNVLNRS